MSFQQLQEKFSLPSKHFFGYLQITDYIQNAIKLPVNQDICAHIASFLKQATCLKNVISSSYSILLSNLPSNLQTVLSGWERDFGKPQIDKDASEIIRNMGNVLACNKTLETLFKILYRLHCTPYIQNKIDPVKSSVCPKCKKEVGTHSHKFGSCPIIASFWNRIKLKLERIFSCTIESDPWYLVLGMVKNEIKLTSCQIRLIYKLLFIDRKCILSG